MRAHTWLEIRQCVDGQVDGRLRCQCHRCESIEVSEVRVAWVDALHLVRLRDAEFRGSHTCERLHVVQPH